MVWKKILSFTLGWGITLVYNSVPSQCRRRTSDWVIANLSTVRPAIALRFKGKGDTSQQNHPRSDYPGVYQRVNRNWIQGHITYRLNAGYE